MTISNVGHASVAGAFMPRSQAHIACDAWDAWARGDDARSQAAQRVRHCVERGELSLNLSGLGLTSLPEHIGQLDHVVDLDLRDNKLQALPESIGQLQQLRALHVGDNALTALPHALGRLKMLRTLVANNNQLRDLPESMREMTELHTLDISENHLESLSPHLPPSITALYAASNQMTSLPDHVTSLPNVQLIDVQFNPLSEDTLSKLEKFSPQSGSLTPIVLFYPSQAHSSTTLG
ncbi:MAG TPA: leucine-rich repeat domain-containing protein [Burkholderiaceae bacterium]|nr:leucine-rich repeat domain-containing protein [Burkholderiaceae bacterium]